MPPKIYQIRKAFSAKPTVIGGKIGLVKNNYPDTFLSNTEPVSAGDNVTIRVLYAGLASTIPPEVIDEVLTVVTNIGTSKHPFRWYQFTSEATPINEEKTANVARKQATKALLDKINNPEKVWIFEVW